MQPPRPSFVLKLLPNLADFAFLMPIAFLFGRMDGVKTMLGDCDTGWHIRTGEWIIAHGRVPTQDIFSYSKPGLPWFAWEWLSEVVMAGLNRAGGLGAVVLFSIVLIALTFTLLYHLVRRRSNALIAIAVTTLAAIASSVHWLARPHLFTLLFLVLFYDALERVREGRTRLWGVPYLAILPVSTILWTNLHGAFFVGVVMIGAYAAGEALQILFAADGTRSEREWSRVWAYLASAAGCLAASFVNPYTYHLHAHMLQYLRDPFTGDHILEFMSISFHHPTARTFEAMLVLGVAAGFWSVGKRRFIEPMVVLIWAHAALLAGRNIPVFAIVAAPVVAGAIEEWLAKLATCDLAGWVRNAVARFQRMAAQNASMELVGRWHLTSLAGVLALAAMIWAPNPPRKFRPEFDPKKYPAGALATLRQDPTARIFANDEWGDYLIWRLFPGQRVFVDGRSDFYGADFEQKHYLDVMRVKQGWENSLASFHVDTILLPPDEPLAGALKESNRWHVVYDDGVALVFRNAPTAGGATISAAAPSVGTGRDREVTKTQASDRAITKQHSKT